MLTRRQLLRRATTTLVLVPLAPVIASCSNDLKHDDVNDTCDGVSSMSSVDAEHSHTVCVPASDLENQPTGASYTTSVDGQHSHVVMLNPLQLGAIEGGSSVTVMCSSAVDPINNATHVHTFVIQMA